MATLQLQPWCGKAVAVKKHLDFCKTSDIVTS